MSLTPTANAFSRQPTLPTAMKAAAVDRFGPPEVLRLHAVPVPKPGPREVLIALHAAGVGVWDAEVRTGTWQPGGPPTFPHIPGTDGAGIVVAAGARVRTFRPGDRAWACQYANPKGGFYAEYAAVDIRNVGHVPPRLDLLHAGAVPTTGLTALQGIDDALHVRRGETILIFGASGGVGTLAVQFARSRGARVIGTASGRDARALVRRLGAVEAIDARSPHGLDGLRIVARGALDAALVLAGGEGLERCLDLVRPGGRIAYPYGVEPEPRRRRIHHLVYDAIAGPREFERLDTAVVKARLQVPLAAVYPLSQASKAHQRIAKGHILGRIVLRIRH